MQLHPDCVCAAARAITVEVTRPQAGIFSFAYTVTGGIGDLRLPPITAKARADGLWRHTCFEAFLRPLPGEAYYEFNFAPSTQWAAYYFSGYRSGMRSAAEIAAPRVDVQAAPDCLTLQATLDLSRLPDQAGWRLGLAAVIEEASSRKSYWALAHPAGNPDFHHAAGFTHELF